MFNRQYAEQVARIKRLQEEADSLVSPSGVNTNGNRWNELVREIEFIKEALAYFKTNDDSLCCVCGFRYADDLTIGY